MNCSSCGIKKIGPIIHPFGGYFCTQEHLQCNECYLQNNSLCGICGSSSKFIQMKYLSSKSSVKSENRENHNGHNESDFYDHNKGVEILYMGAGTTDNSVSLMENSVQQNGETILNKQRSKNFGIVKKEDQKSEVEFPNLVSNTNGFLKENSLLNDSEHQKSLSVKVLRDLETRNSTDNIVVVKNYLDSYCPTTLYNSPSYNCQNFNCDFNRNQRKQKQELKVKSVSVSTESTPRLKSTYSQNPATNKVSGSKTTDFLIMPAIDITPTVPCVLMDKMEKLSIDFRLQKIFKTLKEDSKFTKFEENFDLTKLPTNDTIKQQDEKLANNKPNSEKDDINGSLIKKLLNTHRAFYSPSNVIPTPLNNLQLSGQQEPPLPQFQQVPCSSALATELLQNRSKIFQTKPVPAYVLNIPRSPILCPESSCKRMIFVSDFNKHLVVDHSHLPMERITPFQCKNFFLDARLIHSDISKCHLLYLMRDKITNLGSSEYKDLIPILVMTTRISLNEMCGLRENSSDLDFFLIWVTGIAPEEYPISVTIVIWSRSGKVPACHVVYSGQMYSIRKSQRAFDVWQSGRMLLLSNQEIELLTCNGKEMLNLQLSVH
ncbi:uncharacterized protein ACRADG_002401 [Cochliomyia hominivorax]